LSDAAGERGRGILLLNCVPAWALHPLLVYVSLRFHDRYRFMNRKRTAVVLAASGGIGRACAEKIAEQGDRVVLFSDPP
jgi:hypothetical protein